MKSQVIHLMIAKIEAEKRMVGMSENHPFRSAYEDFLSKIDAFIDYQEKFENAINSQNPYFGRRCFRV